MTLSAFLGFAATNFPLKVLGIAAASGLLVSNSENKLEEKTEIQLLTDVKTLRYIIISTVRDEYNKIQDQK